MYDWANSAFATTVMAAVLPLFYHGFAAVTLEENLRTVYWGYTQTVALVIIAIISPVLGAAADYLGAKKKVPGELRRAGDPRILLVGFHR